MKLTAIQTIIIAFTVLIASGSSVISGSDDTKTVIAVVNGTEITYEQILSIPGAKKKVDLTTLKSHKNKQLIDSLINRQLVLEQARKESFDKSKQVVNAVKALTETYIAKQYLIMVTSGYDLSEEIIIASYKDKYLNKPEQYKIDHILLTTENEAVEILEQLDNGADFFGLAITKSEDKISSVKGGELGWLTTEDMIPSFFKAVSQLTKGKVSAQPIKTPFGWHIVRLVDKRGSTPPPYNDVKQSIHQELIEEKVNNYINNLKSKADIEIK